MCTNPKDTLAHDTICFDNLKSTTVVDCSTRFSTHLLCLAVQASFYSDRIESWISMQEVLVPSSARVKGDL